MRYPPIVMYRMPPISVITMQFLYVAVGALVYFNDFYTSTGMFARQSKTLHILIGKLGKACKVSNLTHIWKYRNIISLTKKTFTGNRIMARGSKRL